MEAHKSPNSSKLSFQSLQSAYVKLYVMSYWSKDVSALMKRWNFLS